MNHYNYDRDEPPYSFPTPTQRIRPWSPQPYDQHELGGDGGAIARYLAGEQDGDRGYAQPHHDTYNELGTADYDYNVLGFSTNSLTNASHELLISTTGNGSLVLFDYLTYRYAICT